MNNASAKKALTPAQRAAEIAKLDLHPAGKANQRTDALLRSMFNTPPEPFTPKPTAKKAPKK